MSKVVNGYGIHTSQQSITHIGTASATQFAQQQQQRRQMFREEATKVSRFTEKLHPSRKVLHMQSNYPETVKKLQGIYQPESHQPVTSSQYMRPVRTARNETALQSHLEQLKNETTREYRWNARTKLYNNSRGRKATVDKIIIGQGPASNGTILYPQNATHQQLLALTKSLAMPDPRIPAPEVTPRAKYTPAAATTGGYGIFGTRTTSNSKAPASGRSTNSGRFGGEIRASTAPLPTT